jgi:ParB family chromosome partitioning protein
MKIQLENIQNDVFDVREDVDQEHVDDIAESFKRDGQWDPIIVRPSKNGDYELISGHNRCRAAWKLDWNEIEATVKDVSDEKANELALTTNLLRSDLTQREQGKVLVSMLNEHELTQSDLADRIGKSTTWVGDRVSLALDLHESVVEALESGSISNREAAIVASLDKSDQEGFVNIVRNAEINSAKEVRELKDRFLNDTIYTIGYRGQEFSEFLQTLQDAKIDVLVDIRESSDSTYKPEYNGDVLSDRLESEGIEYRHIPELGVPYLVRAAYKDEGIGDSCFESWYRWYIVHDWHVELAEFADELEGTGRSALMCAERHATPQKDQSIYCHRHFLADILQHDLTSGSDDEMEAFPNREDL